MYSQLCHQLKLIGRGGGEEMKMCSLGFLAVSVSPRKPDMTESGRLSETGEEK